MVCLSIKLIPVFFTLSFGFSLSQLRHKSLAYHGAEPEDPCSYRKGTVKLQQSVEAPYSVTCVVNKYAVSLFEDDSSTSLVRSVRLGDIFRPVVVSHGCLDIGSESGEAAFQLCSEEVDSWKETLNTFFDCAK
jgi:hypothetical protein